MSGITRQAENVVCTAAFRMCLRSSITTLTLRVTPNVSQGGLCAFVLSEPDCLYQDRTLDGRKQ